MLKINPDPTFSHVVEITVPGQTEPGTLNLTFKYRGRKDYADWIDTLSEKKDKKGKTKQKGKTVSEAFPEFVLDWELDEEFSSENFEIFLNNYPAAYGEIFSEYSKLLLLSRIKN